MKKKKDPFISTQSSPLFLNVCVDSKICAWVYRSLHVFKRQSVRAGLLLEYLCVFEGERADGVCVFEGWWHGRWKSLRLQL